MNTKDPFQQTSGDGVCGSSEELHFPSTEELLREKPFFRNDFREDVLEFCNRLEAEAERQGLSFSSPMLTALESLRERLTQDRLHELAECVTASESNGSSLLHESPLRCSYYLAASGEPDAAAQIARETALMAIHDMNKNRSLEMVGVTLSWGATAGFISGLARFVDLQPSVGAVAHFRGNIRRMFKNAIAEHLQPNPAHIGELRDEALQSSISPPMIRLVQDRENSVPIGPYHTQEWITLTGPELIAILHAAASPETLSSALACVGILVAPEPIKPDSLRNT